MPILVNPPESGLGPGISALSQAIGRGLETRTKGKQRQSLLEGLQAATTPRQPLPLTSQGAEQPGEGRGVLGQTLDSTPLPDPSVSRLGPRFSPSQVLSATMIDKDLGKAFIEQNKAVDERNKIENAEIQKYAEPFKNVTEIRSNLERLQRAKEMIESKGVALDENQMRNFTSAFLEDRGWESIAQLFKTDEQKQLFALLKPFFKVKELGGSNPSTREVMLTLSTLPGPLLGKAANINLVDAMIADQASKLEKANTIRELRKKGDYSFSEFQDIVEQRGEQRLKEQKELFAKQAAPQPSNGRALDKATINKIIDEVGPSREAIIKRAKELGYKV